MPDFGSRIFSACNVRAICQSVVHTAINRVTVADDRYRPVRILCLPECRVLVEAFGRAVVFCRQRFTVHSSSIDYAALAFRIEIPFQSSVRCMSSIDEILSLCETRIGYQFRDRALLRRCLTHSSSAETRLDSNERLEFLGDAVLGLVIVEYLFQLFPDQREGQLTQMKSWLVSRQTCARVARLLDAGSLILVGRGLQNIPDSILSAVVESLIAGVYFDGGIDAARTFILTAFQEELALCKPVDTDNFKSQLQEYTQRELGKTPEYIVVEERGPDHAREFGVAARVGDAVFGIGRGKSKKEAEQHAARNAVLSLLKQEPMSVTSSEPAAGILVDEEPPLAEIASHDADSAQELPFGAGCEMQSESLT